MPDLDPETFDWRTQTTLKGTVSRLGQYVRGNCACGEEDVLVYDTYDDETLMCAGCSRVRSLANPRVELCDDCGAKHAWRDPIAEGGKVFRCGRCHARAGTVFQNRWSTAPRTIKTGMAKCDARGITECKGEIKWRGAHKRSLCNKHAGVKSADERNN